MDYVLENLLGCIYIHSVPPCLTLTSLESWSLGSYQIKPEFWQCNYSSPLQSIMKLWMHSERATFCSDWKFCKCCMKCLIPLPSTHSLTESQNYYDKNTFAWWHLSGHLLGLLDSDFHRPRNKCLQYWGSLQYKSCMLKELILISLECRINSPLTAQNGCQKWFKKAHIYRQKSWNKRLNLQILMPRFTWQDMHFCYFNTVRIWCCCTWAFPKTDISTLSSIYRDGAVSLYGIHEFGPIKEGGWLCEREVCMSSIS